MKITYLKTIGFRKFEKEFETEIYDITNIIGGNTKGKTNVLYAIIWAFLGTNLTGDERVWLGNNKTDNCYVELNFIDNQNKSHKLVRYKHKFDNKKNCVLLDDKQVSSEELQSYYGDKKLFVSIINPSYFINKKPAEQKELLEKYLPNIDISSVYNSLDKTEKSYLEGMPENIISYLKELNSNKKLLEDKIKNLKGKIEYIENNVDFKIPESKSFTKSEELFLARQELSFLSLDTNAQEKKKQEEIVSNLNSQISQLEREINRLSSEMMSGKNRYLSIKQAKVACCPMCQQEIKDESRLNTISNMRTELEASFEKKKTLENDLSNLKMKLVTERCNLHALEGKSNQENADKINLVKKQIASLEEEQLQVEKFNNEIQIQKRNIENSKKDILTFQNQIIDYEKTIDDIGKTRKIAEKLFINYIEEKMKFATQYLNNVEIKYYTVLKETGEIKEDFIITYKGNEFKDLSKSETIATSIELRNMFNMISGVNVPIFIDDSESCADYDFISNLPDNTQVFISSVEKGHELQISDYKQDDFLLNVA